MSDNHRSMSSAMRSSFSCSSSSFSPEGKARQDPGELLTVRNWLRWTRTLHLCSTLPFRAGDHGGLCVYTHIARISRAHPIGLLLSHHDQATLGSNYALLPSWWAGFRCPSRERSTVVPQCLTSASFRKLILTLPGSLLVSIILVERTTSPILLDSLLGI